MRYKILLTHSANQSYFEELEFIYKKWNATEVILFEELVENKLSQLTINPFSGIYNDDYDWHTLLISKQTKLLN